VTKYRTGSALFSGREIVFYVVLSMLVNRGLLYERMGEKLNNVYFASLFKGINSISRPMPGNSTLQQSINGHGGIHKAILIQAACIALATCIILLVLFTLLFIIRQRTAAHTRDRESALTTLKAIGDAVITTNQDQQITYVNPSAEALLSRSSDQLVGQDICKTISFTTDTRENQQGETECALADAMNTNSIVTLPTLQLSAEGDAPVFVSSTFSLLGHDANAQNNGHVMVMRNVSAEREMTRELAFLATHDSLTEISNRYYFEKELKVLIESSVKDDQKHSICYIDLDQFKTINDTCGHSAGDRLLVRVTQGLKSIIRKKDVLARLGGDEFGLLIKNCEEDEAVEIAKSIHDFFQTFYFQNEQDVFAVRASIGFVHISSQFNSIEDVMAAADLACYSDKDKGRNELYIFNHYHNETSDRMSVMMWLPKLPLALRSDNFRLFVQSIVDIQSGAEEHNSAYHHYEILLRLVAEDGSLITPVQPVQPRISRLVRRVTGKADTGQKAI